MLNPHLCLPFPKSPTPLRFSIPEVLRIVTTEEKVSVQVVVINHEATSIQVRKMSMGHRSEA